MRSSLPPCEIAWGSYVAMDQESLRKVGHRFGTGAIMVFDQNSCIVAATLNLMEYFARESCGFCTPCREGLPYIRDLLWRLENGDGKEEFIPMIREMARHMDKAYCAFAPGAAQPILGKLAALPGAPAARYFGGRRRVSG